MTDEVTRAEQVKQPGAGQPPKSPQQLANELRQLLEVEPVSWPVANPRQHREHVPPSDACGHIETLLEDLESDESVRRDGVEEWRAKHALPGVLGALVPGIAAQLDQGERLITEGLDWIKRLQAYYDAAETNDRVLGDIAVMEAIAAGELPQEEE